MGGTCPLFLFQGAVVDTPGKYAGAIIGAFLLAMAMEVRWGGRCGGRFASGFRACRRLTRSPCPVPFRTERMDGMGAMQGARHARAWLRRRRPALATNRPVAVPILLEVRGMVRSRHSSMHTGRG